MNTIELTNDKHTKADFARMKSVLAYGMLAGRWWVVFPPAPSIPSMSWETYGK